MKVTLLRAAIFFFLCTQLAMADEVKLVKVSFPGSAKPKTVVIKNKNLVFTQFSTSSSYKMEVEVDCDIPINTAFNVRTYALVNGKRISLGDARVGRAQGMGHSIFISYHIFPSSANFHGNCRFVCVVDADNEISENDESALSNEWAFNAVIQN